MEENVLRGNSAVVKCHIPSFVTEYVTVSSWIISEGEVNEVEIQLDQSFNLGIRKQLIPISSYPIPGNTVLNAKEFISIHALLLLHLQWFHNHIPLIYGKKTSYAEMPLYLNVTFQVLSPSMSRSLPGLYQRGIKMKRR